MVYVDDDSIQINKESIMSEPFFVRLETDLKDWLNQYVEIKGRPFNNTYIINKILRYFKNASPDEQAAMMGMQLPAVASVGRLSEIMAWADHAFRADRWEWAIETYYKLLEESRGALGYERFAHYKIGFCWLEIALDLRQEAINATPWC